MSLRFEDCEPVGVAVLSRDSDPVVDLARAVAPHLDPARGATVAVGGPETDERVDTTVDELSTLPFVPERVGFFGHDVGPDRASR